MQKSVDDADTTLKIALMLKTCTIGLFASARSGLDRSAGDVPKQTLRVLQQGNIARIAKLPYLKSEL